MAYRKPQLHFPFADLAVETLADKNRALSVLKQLNATTDWKPIEQLLEQFYHTGKRAEGGKAYTPLLLFKCLMLQNGFKSPPIPNWKARSTTAFPLNPFWDCPWISRLRITPPSHDSAAGCLKRP